MTQLLAIIPDGKICDFIDQKIRDDTPKESVRQNIERRLVLDLGYLPHQIEVDYAIQQGTQTICVDLAIFREGDPHTQENIWIIIECKEVQKANQQEVEQLRSYMIACDACEWGMWTNGKAQIVLGRIETQNKIEYKEFNDLPSKNGCIERLNDEICAAKFLMGDIKFDYSAEPIWELAARLSAKVPEEEWAKLPQDLAQNFDHYQ